MSAPSDGGPAFPYAFEHRDPPQCGFAPGMSLRDWFAGQALTGLVSGSISAQAGKPNLMLSDTAFSVAYASADAMLAERAKGGTQ